MRKVPASLFLLLILVVTLFPFTRVNADIESLWCSGYTSNRLGWTTTGSSPYLDDTDGNYIYTKTDGQTEGDFSFSDLSSAGTITSVTLYLETYANDAPNDDGFNVWIYDGSSWTNEGTIQPSTTGWGNYETLSLTTKLDTDIKVNAAQIYFEYIKSKGADYVYIRRAYLYVDYTPSSAEQFYRYPSQDISWSGSNSRDWTLKRTFSQGLTVSSDSFRTWSLSRTSNQAVVFNSDGERTLGASRMVSQDLTATMNGNRAWSIVREVSQSLSTSLNSDRLFSAIRDVSQSISTTLNGNRAWSIVRGVSQGLTTVFNSDREWDLIRVFSQDLTMTLNGNRVFSKLLKATQSLTASFSAGRTWDLSRTVSQTLTFTSNALADLYTLIQRTASLTLNIISNSDRGWLLKRVLSQEFTFVSNGERLFDAIRVLSQSLTTTLNANRVFTAVRTASQSLTTTISASRTWELKRILSQSMTFISNISVELIEGFTYFHRYVSIGLNLVLDGSRIWDISRSVSQTISFTSDALGDLLEFYSRTASLTLNFVSSGIGQILGSFGWLLSLIVTDFDDIPLENATVTLIQNNTEGINYWITDINGSIPDQLLFPDDYFLEVSKNEYLTNGRSFYLSSDTFLSIQLEGAWIETNPEILGLFGLCLIMQILYAYGLSKGTRPMLTMIAGALTALSWYTTGQVILIAVEDVGIPISYLLSGFSTVNTVLLFRIIYAALTQDQEE